MINGPHTVERVMKDGAVRAIKDGSIAQWPRTRSKYKANKCVLCTAHSTDEDGSRVVLHFRDTKASVTTKCVACNAYLCMRTLPGERTSCWHKFHMQKRLQRPNGGTAKRVTLRGRVIRR